MYEKKYVKGSIYSFLGWTMVIKQESFLDKIYGRFLWKREYIWFGNAKFDGIN